MPYICFDATLDPVYEKESLYLNQDNPIDSLLKSSFDFLDVNDSSAVNKILDDASIMHAQRAQKRNPLWDEYGDFMTFDKELEASMKVAVKHETENEPL